MDLSALFDALPSRYRPRPETPVRSYYVSLGGPSYTLFIAPDGVRVERGKATARADYVLKTTPELFHKMVVHGKLPGPIDLALGRVKTNDPLAFRQLRELFDLRGL
jgi:hypothetical protein